MTTILIAFSFPDVSSKEYRRARHTFGIRFQQDDWEIVIPKKTIGKSSSQKKTIGKWSSQRKDDLGIVFPKKKDLGIALPKKDDLYLKKNDLSLSKECHDVWCLRKEFWV